MRSTKKIMLLALLVSAATAMSACGDANTGSPGEFKTAGGTPTQDPSGAAPAGSSTSSTGGSTPSTGTSTPAAGGGTFAVASSMSAVSSELNMTTQIPVTITPAGGFTGTVILSASGLPAGATGTFTPDSLSITGTAPVTAMYALDVPSSVTPTATAATLQITGTAGASVANAPVAVTVERKITISIPMNVEADATAFGTTPIVIHAGAIGTGAQAIQVQFINNDSSAAAGHIVHSSNTTNGFFHGDQANPVKPGQPDALRTVTGAGNYPFYMHNENVNIGNTVQIMVP
jgi:hypothetical protein